MGIPPGMRYTPADHSGNGAQSVAIVLYVTYASSDSICFDTAECTPDGGPNLRARRGYARVRGAPRRGERAGSGGLRTDRALLRQATLDARPATDDEPSRALPPLRPRNLLDRPRQWLRTF
jgi:hypothetical protein